MKTLLFLTADFANLTQDNKINILGIFNQIWANTYPFVFAQFALVAKVGLEAGEERRNRKLTLYFAGEDANTQKAKVMEETFDFPDRIGGLEPEHSVILNMRGVGFPSPGTYQFLLHIDDRFLSSLSLHLSLVQPQPPAPVLQPPEGG